MIENFEELNNEFSFDTIFRKITNQTLKSKFSDRNENEICYSTRKSKNTHGFGFILN